MQLALSSMLLAILAKLAISIAAASYRFQLLLFRIGRALLPVKKLFLVFGCLYGTSGES
ncbi:hypothetical protein S1OALGB6SA_630 [Olavius algarvensis spirochete endosymbiont]|nr:hypothetical protein S1OALGB6SA_630 [Olavius algarvensis spirochete endosymbiont]